MEDEKSIFASYYIDKLGIDDSLEDHKISERVEQHYDNKYGEDLEGMLGEIYKDVNIILEQEGKSLPTGYAVVGEHNYPTIFFNGCLGGRELSRWPKIHWKKRQENSE